MIWVAFHCHCWVAFFVPLFSFSLWLSCSYFSHRTVYAQHVLSLPLLLLLSLYFSFCFAVFTLFMCVFWLLATGSCCVRVSVCLFVYIFTLWLYIYFVFVRFADANFWFYSIDWLFNKCFFSCWFYYEHARPKYVMCCLDKRCTVNELVYTIQAIQI